MYKIIMNCFSLAITIISLALAVSCEGKHLKTLPQTPPNPKPSYDHELDSKSSTIIFPPSYSKSIQGSMSAVFRSSLEFDKNGTVSRQVDENMQPAVASCHELLSLALYNLNISLPSNSTNQTLDDMKTSLCATLAYIEACTDAFQYAPEKDQNIVAASLRSSRENINNSLSILSTVDDQTYLGLGSSPPSWMSSEETKFLFDSEKADVVVAKDGSGRFKTINEAIKFAPRNSVKVFVIYVKQGIYSENVKVDESCWNIRMFGDGMDKTIVTGNLSNATGSSIIDGATFAVYGRGFIARDMGFENTAGPSSKQAVALLSSSDKSVFYKCRIRGYQDTLLTLANRQFYRECQISGTIDFIFGYSSAVFQSCTIRLRKPLPGQKNTITAQGKSDPRCPSGFSIQKSNVGKAEDLTGVQSFLGRPWKAYSTTVFMESSLGGLIDPQGWLRWKPDQPIPDTVYYGEYKNTGSDQSRRVQGEGIKPRMSDGEANMFTVRQFIDGDEWLPPTAVPYQAGL